MKEEQPSSSETTAPAESTTTEPKKPAEPTNENKPNASQVGEAFFAGSSNGAKMIFPIVAVIAVLGGAAYALIPTINRLFGLNLPEPKLPKIPGLN